MLVHDCPKVNPPPMSRCATVVLRSLPAGSAAGRLAAMKRYKTHPMWAWGHAFRMLGESAGLTQAEVADRAGVDRGQWNRFLAGTKGLGWDRIEAAMGVLGVSLKELAELAAQIEREAAVNAPESALASWLRLYHQTTPEQRNAILGLIGLNPKSK